MMYSRKTWFVTILVFILLIFAMSTYAAEPLKLSIASFKSGSGWYVLAQAMSQVIKKNLPEGTIVDVLPYSGGSGNPPLLHLKKASLALGYNHLTLLAMKGKPP